MHTLERNLLLSPRLPAASLNPNLLAGCGTITGKASQTHRNAPCPCGKQKPLRGPDGKSIIAESKPVYVEGFPDAVAQREVMIPVKFKDCCMNKTDEQRREELQKAVAAKNEQLRKAYANAGVAAHHASHPGTDPIDPPDDVETEEHGEPVGLAHLREVAGRPNAWGPEWDGPKLPPREELQSVISAIRWQMPAEQQ